MPALLERKSAMHRDGGEAKMLLHSVVGVSPFPSLRIQLPPAAEVERGGRGSVPRAARLAWVCDGALERRARPGSAAGGAPSAHRRSTTTTPSLPADPLAHGRLLPCSIFSDLHLRWQRRGDAPVALSRPPLSPTSYLPRVEVNRGDAEQRALAAALFSGRSAKVPCSWRKRPLGQPSIQVASGQQEGVGGDGAKRDAGGGGPLWREDQLRILLPRCYECDRVVDPIVVVGCSSSMRATTSTVCPCREIFVWQESL